MTWIGSNSLRQLHKYSFITVFLSHTRTHKNKTQSVNAFIKFNSVHFTVQKICNSAYTFYLHTKQVVWPASCIQHIQNHFLHLQITDHNLEQVFTAYL